MDTMQKAQEWANNKYYSEESRGEIQTLINENNTKEIEERFYREIEFGTGGLRSILGAGTNRMNIYNIRKATQALAGEVLDHCNKNNISTPKVAISYDSRKFSFEFAKETAAVMAANGIKAFIYNRLNPVALLSFSVRYHAAQAGVMVTASHNPPEYNGYKVYWNDGAQVTPPNDKNIITRYNNLTSFDQVKVMDFDEAVAKEMIIWVGEKVENKYFEAILSKAINPDFALNNGGDLKIVYTPIHGTGLIPCLRALSDLGFKNVEVVKEQAQPDSRFPTVKSPNPENPEALAMAVELMNKTNSDIVLGSDPDTDRLGVALKHNGEIVYLNGNQIGILMLEYIFGSLKSQNKLPKNSYFVKTIVTTPLQDVIASHYGVETFNTLTGFKWICGLMNKMEIQHPEKNFIFATEESFGYLPHNYVRDKDGVASVTLMSEVALHYKKQGLNLVQALDKIYEKYGFSMEELLNLNYYGKEGSEKISRIMAHFRTLKPESLCGYKINVIEDYEEKVTLNLVTNEEVKLDFPKSNVIGYHFEGGSRLYLRPSGTEPKIKFYIMINEAEGSLDEKRANALVKVNKFLNFINETANGL